jgi:transcriptional regulator of nitric oxide reductase
VTPLKTPAVAALLLLAAGTAVLVAQRIFTNPKPQNLFRKLFPDAVAFSPHEGEPLHFKAFGVDPRTNPGARPIGYIFWTTDLVPREHGYHGPIHLLVGMDTAGIITSVIVDYHGEPYGYFSLDPPQFAAQFTGKSIRDPFRVGADVDAVSRATITISSAARAIRDSSRGIAKAYLSPGEVKR